MRSRGYCFTLNNYTDEEEEALKNLQGYKYLLFGKEVSTTGTPHLQGYLYFTNKKSFKQVKATLGDRFHVEAQRGSCEQAINYCKKDGSFFEIGNPPMTSAEKGECGKRIYEEAFQLAKEGKIEEIPEPLRTRFYGTYKRIRKDYQSVPASIDTLENEWYYGETGSGKSRKAREENPDAYLKNANKWWDGYQDQDVVIIDEFSPEHQCLASHLKQWADHHPFAGEIKGGMLCIRPKKIIITSNYHPREIFERPGDLEPVMRRFKVIHFSRQFNPL